MSARPIDPSLKLAAFIALFLFGLISGAFAFTSVNVPLGDWSYGAVDKLIGFGLIDSDLQGTRPFSRLEMARLIARALAEKKLGGSDLPRLATDLLDRLQREYREELELVGKDTDILAKSFLKPLHEVEGGYVYVQGQPREFVNIKKGVGNYPGSNAGIIASEGTALLYNHDGVNFGEHHNAYLQFSSMMGFRSFFAGYLEPIFLVRQNEGHVSGLDSSEVDLLRGYGKLSGWNVELEGGRDSLWWGYGRHGSLILTNNATPLNLLKLSNPEPILLPWVFRYLGLFKYTVFATRLDNYPTPPDPNMAGFRLNFKPHPLVEFGLSTTMQFGGEGQPGLTLDDLLRILSFRSPQNANQLAALDMKFRLPFLRNAEFYMEYGGEDSGGWDPSHPNQIIFDDDAWLFGLYFPRLTCDGKADLRLEYLFNAHRVDETPGFWYGHSRYRAGYTHDGMIMGHHVGPDAEDFFARTSYYLRNNLIMGLDYDYMRRGITLNPVEERVNQMGLDCTFDVWDYRLSFTARYAFGVVQNFDNQAGDNRYEHLLTTSVKLRF